MKKYGEDNSMKKKFKKKKKNTLSKLKAEKKFFETLALLYTLVCRAIFLLKRRKLQSPRVNVITSHTFP
jgi:hypothetical protein